MSLAECFSDMDPLAGERQELYREAGIGSGVVVSRRPPRVFTLSLLQPWASLIILGAKRVETRSWPPPTKAIGELLAIHASARFPREMRECFEVEPFRSVLGAAGYRCWQELPLGAVLGVTRLTDAAQTEDLAPRLSAQELAFGDYGPNRWGWEVELLRRFEQPFPAKGSLGIWSWEAPAEVLEGLE